MSPKRHSDELKEFNHQISIFEFKAVRLVLLAILFCTLMRFAAHEIGFRLTAAQTATSCSAPSEVQRPDSARRDPIASGIPLR